MENGQINWNDETLVKYGNNWFFVKNGHVDWSYSGDCRYDGTFYTVKNGVMTGVDEGKIWKYDTRYAHKYDPYVRWADGTKMSNAELKEIYESENKDACIYLASAGSGDIIAANICEKNGWSFVNPEFTSYGGE